VKEFIDALTAIGEKHGFDLEIAIENYEGSWYVPDIYYGENKFKDGSVLRRCYIK